MNGFIYNIEVPTGYQDNRAEVENKRLKQEKNDLHGALTRLLAKPRCGRCRKAARAVADRIKLEA